MLLFTGNWTKQLFFIFTKYLKLCHKSYESRVQANFLLMKKPKNSSEKMNNLNSVVKFLACEVLAIVKKLHKRGTWI